MNVRDLKKLVEECRSGNSAAYDRDDLAAAVVELSAPMTELREAWLDLSTGLIAVSPHLSMPYPDDPRWSPWSRFVECEIERVEAALVLACQGEPS